jgi:tRNA(adenine34) deaminase
LHNSAIIAYNASIILFANEFYFIVIKACRPFKETMPHNKNITQTDFDKHWMQRALELAQHAANQGEVPVGAVLTLDNQLIGEGWNCPISTLDMTHHAEIMALRAAAKAMNNYRLPSTTLYVTLEPCIMCVGALLQARIKRLVFGAPNTETGVVVSQTNMLDAPFNTHHIHYEGGLLEEASRKILQHFFQNRRKNHQKN